MYFQCANNHKTEADSYRANEIVCRNDYSGGGGGEFCVQ